MAIGIFKSLIFGDVDSADYGIYITGEAVYNAPQRAVEMVTVPGRNGAIALDQGRWENIEVNYPAGCFGGDQSDFASKISDFRNAIVSQIGYQRLTDEFNPNEYRMAVYASGLDVKPKSTGKAGEFTITFDCKPQRYLTSGETEITVESGDTVTNPTQYGSSPLLAVEGYGTIGFNGYAVELEDVVIGDLYYHSGSTVIIRPTVCNTGDTITCDSPWFRATAKVNSPYAFRNIAATITDTNPLFHTQFAATGTSRQITTTVDIISFLAGTPKEESNTATIVIPVENNGTYGTATVTLTQSVKQYLTSSIIIGTSKSGSVTYTTPSAPITLSGVYGETGQVDVYSTISLLGHPTYIDCDLGECYKIENDEYISLNGKIALGSDLPTLAPGGNRIIYDNTVTQLKIVPRWWKL